MAKAKTTTTAKFDNPYKEGSGKRVVYDAFMTAGGGETGLAAAHKAAKKNDIKEGTVKSWSSMWLKGQTKPGASATTTKPKADKADKGPDVVRTCNGAFDPLFKFTSRERADREHEALCTRNGLRPHSMHVIEDGGRFAVVPANYSPGGPAPQFKAGDIVYDALIANSRAKVIEPGSEQTMVRYAEERPNRPREDCVINRFLVKLPEAAAKKSKGKTTTRQRL